MLSYEAKTIERLQKRGRIDSGEASRMMGEIDKRFKLLQKHPPTIEKDSVLK